MKFQESAIFQILSYGQGIEEKFIKFVLYKTQIKYSDWVLLKIKWVVLLKNGIQKLKCFRRWDIISNSLKNFEK